ncbi:MAG: hypothetical protein GQ565_08040 [Candidatus Aegiribacteria sp.]|nr:hypothetical protein [Candidatus Aegiribacteria sp.]
MKQEHPATPELSPREERERDGYRGGIKRIDWLADLFAELLSSVELPGNVDENLGELSIYAPVPLHIGVGKIVKGYPATAAVRVA